MTTKMNPEIKTKWLSALRSGEYKQTQERLSDCDGFCCLGVLTDLYIKETGIGKWDKDEDGSVTFASDDEFESGVLPVEVKNWAGLPDTSPLVIVAEDEDWGQQREALAELNDAGEGFATLADKIEETY